MVNVLQIMNPQCSAVSHLEYPKDPLIFFSRIPEPTDVFYVHTKLIYYNFVITLYLLFVILLYIYVYL